MRKEILDLLDTEGKDWHEANNNLLLFGLIFEKEKNRNKVDNEFYRTMLGDGLYEYNLTQDEYEIIIHKFEELIKENSSFSITCAGVLGEAHDENVYYFLFNQLKEKYQINSELAISILRSLNGRVFSGYKELLRTIIKDENANNELKEEAENQLKVIFRETI